MDLMLRRVCAGEPNADLFAQMSPRALERCSRAVAQAPCVVRAVCREWPSSRRMEPEKGFPRRLLRPVPPLPTATCLGCYRLHLATSSPALCAYVRTCIWTVAYGTPQRAVLSRLEAPGERRKQKSAARTFTVIWLFPCGYTCR